MPGTEMLTLRANCRMRQTRQAVADLKALGIIKTARRSAPGVRAVYEILPMCVDNPGNGCGHSRTRTGADSGATGADSAPTGADDPQRRDQPKHGNGAGHSVAVSDPHSVTS